MMVMISFRIRYWGLLLPAGGPGGVLVVMHPNLEDLPLHPNLGTEPLNLFVTLPLYPPPDPLGELHHPLLLLLGELGPEPLG